MATQLKKWQEDALKELGTMGAGHAATALSKLVNQKVQMSVPHAKLIQLKEIPKIFKSEQKIYTAVYMEVISEIKAGMMLIFSNKNAIRLSNILNKREDTILKELGVSSLKECANICINAYLNALNNFIDLWFTPTIPSLVTDMIGAILDGVAIEFSQKGESALVIENQLKVGEKALTAHIVFFPSDESLKLILDTLDEKGRKAA